MTVTEFLEANPAFITDYTGQRMRVLLPSNETMLICREMFLYDKENSRKFLEEIKDLECIGLEPYGQKLNVSSNESRSGSE